jgi:uncharacterized phage protein (TIGR02218 family)
MQGHLDTRTTTLCWCWKITRNDGEVLGFTDHDRVLSFDGTDYEAETGITASDVRESVGLNVDNVDIQGAVSSASITEADLAAGLYDGAAVELYLVNWSNVSHRVLIRKGSVGEVTRREHLFIAEMRGLAYFLNQEMGRTFQYQCDAQLGDGRCAKDVSGSTFTGTGAVDTVEANYRFTATGLDTYDSAWFSGGFLTWTSGANNGRSTEVKFHNLDAAGTVLIELWQEPSETVVSGDDFTIVAGCDKTFNVCRDKFNNLVNFRGFPHIPGNKIITNYPTPADPDNDGNSMWDYE